MAAEFTTPAVSAPSFARALAPKVRGAPSVLERVIRRENPHVAWVETAGHGYLLLDVTAERIEGQWWHVDGVGRRTGEERLAATWSVTARHGGTPASAAAPLPRYGGSQAAQAAGPGPSTGHTLSPRGGGAETKASWGTSTRPIVFIFFLPSFCFSSSLRLRLMSPP